MKQRLLNLIIVLTVTASASAQVFTVIPGITAKMNYTFVSNDFNLAVMGGAEHYKSVNQGVTWTEMNNDAGSGLYQVEGYSIAVSDASTMCVAGFNPFTLTYVIARTTDGGATWNQTLSNPYTTELKDIAANGNTVIATATNGIYRSSDAGATWTFVQLSSGNQVSSFVCYNGNAGSWIVGGYTANFHTSSDGGLTWQETGLGFPPASVVATSAAAGGVLFAKDNTTATQMIYLDAVNTPDTIVTIQGNLVLNGVPCKTGDFLANNNLLTHNQYLFYIADTSNNHVYQVNSPTANGYFPKSLSLGSGYGIAFGNNSSGNQSRAYLINLAQPAVVSVPSYFEIAGPGPCAGDVITAAANATYADSYKWYVNNVLVSTTTTLSYPTPPGVYTTYNVKLETYYNGQMHTTTKPVVMSAPQAPHTFVYTVDTTACYGEALHVFINPDPGTPASTALKILYNGQLVFGPVTMTAININAYTPALTTGGTLQIITYKTLYCDPGTDTIAVNIEVGPNLFDFDVLQHDSIICTGVNPVLGINGTSSLYTYDFYSSYSIGTWTSAHFVTPGNSVNTLQAPQWGLDSYTNNNSTPEAYGPMYMYVHLEINDTAGCSPARIIDTIRIQRPTAYFELHSRSFLQSDTVQLSNAFVTGNRLWSSPGLNPAFILNQTDTIPLIMADTTGFFGIELHNEPLEGCADSVTQYIHYANQAPEMDPACVVKEVHEADYLHHTRIDQFGNIYEVRAYPVTIHNYPVYILRKNDAFGNLLWEKKGLYTGWGYNVITGIAIEEIDFDVEGNPVIAMWINGTGEYEDDYFDYTPGGTMNGGACYVAKVDKTTGDLIWRTNLSDMFPTANLYNGTRITDVVTDGGLIHATTYTDYNLDFFTLNSADGSPVNTSPLNLDTWSNTQFILPNFLVSGLGSLGDSRQSFWSPQIDVLSTGEVVAIGNYQDGVTFPNHPQLEMIGSGAGIFVMKYHPDNGVYDVDNIAWTGTAQFNSGPGYQAYRDIPRMFVDKNDNITVSGYWDSGYETTEISILDSVLPMKTGTFVFNMDADYNMNWLSTGTHSHVEDMAYVAATNETYLSCRTRDNFSIGTGTVHLMGGEEQHYEFEYTSLPYYEYPWLNYPQNQVFLTRFDAEGKPVEMKQFDYYPTVSNYVPQAAQRLAATACGDLALFTTGGEMTGITADGQSYLPDSVMLFLNYSGCASDDCSYLDAHDAELCAVNGTIGIQLSDYYNLNSLTYNLIVNGSVVASNQSASVSNGWFSIPAPSANGEFTLAFTAPNADTMTVTYLGIQVTFGTLSQDSVCTYGAAVSMTGGSPLGGVYSGTGVTAGQFDPALAGPGTHVITYTYMAPSGCEGSVTDSVFVDVCAGLEAPAMTIFRAHPNPFTDELHIVASGETGGHPNLVIYDQTGRIVLQQALQGEHTSLQLDRLSKGNYLLEISDGEKQLYRERLIKM